MAELFMTDEEEATLTMLRDVVIFATTAVKSARNGLGCADSQDEAIRRVVAQRTKMVDELDKCLGTLVSWPHAVRNPTMSIESCAMLVRVLAAGIASEFPEIREKLDAAQVSSDVSRVAAKK